MARFRAVGWSRHSLRGKLIAIVAGGVIVPLALVAAWTTHRLRGAGEALLHSQLDASLSGMERVIDRNWRAQRADLLLLSDNNVVARALRSRTASFDAKGARFLEDAFRIVQPVVDEVVFSDSLGRARWRVAPDPGLQPRLEELSEGQEHPASRLGSVAVDMPVRAPGSAHVVGTMTALVRLSALVQTPALVGTAGVSVEIQDARGVPLARWDAAAGAPDHPGEPLSGAQVSVARTLGEPPLRLVAHAPLDPFVEPFAHDARIGMMVYGGVLAAALGIAGWLAMRATGTLRRLAEGADAVAHGDLEYQIDVDSPDEIGRVADAFNAMTRDLRRSLRDASQRNALAAVGAFAAELAHEVRNPLTSVRLDLQRLHERLPSDSKMRDPLVRVLSVLERLNRTVTGALRVARSGTITPARLQLRSALEPALQAAGPTFTSRHIALQRDLGDVSSAWLRGDADALTQLFTNVLINAAEAVDRAGSVSVSAALQNGSVSVMIADSGSGMPPEIMRQLDEQFHTTTKQGGTGLGLTIARRIATAHGGRIEFACPPGSGTIVTITLPREAATTSSIA